MFLPTTWEVKGDTLLSDDCIILTMSIALVELLVVPSEDVLQLGLEVVVLLGGGVPDVPGPLPAGLPGPGPRLGRDLGRLPGPGLSGAGLGAGGLDHSRPETLVTWGEQRNIEEYRGRRV